MINSWLNFYTFVIAEILLIILACIAAVALPGIISIILVGFIMLASNYLCLLYSTAALEDFLMSGD